MRLLLPPSEAKHPGGRGRPLGTRIAGPLAQPRAEVASAVARLAEGDADAAAEALLLPAGVMAQALRADARVLTSPTVPALRRYSGVVYDGLDYPGMTPAQRKIAHRSVLIFSGLLGVVRGDEATPDYRVPAKAALPGLGVAATYWRPRLAPMLDAALRTQFVIDLRSSDYAAMWRPRGALAEQVVEVRVLSPLPRGGHGVISYVSKHAKGRLAAALIARVAAGGTVERADDVAAAWSTIGGAGCAARDAGLDLLTG
ncbi:peroxide stress protein YaaA [uncultured Jatrophihabitans sp.]|uniref:peroxide stress protein YaaA n=1 Tax=uncultured Jatrophihabitans sp. TaxID=1610747 RepID=UPI0035C9E777